MKNNEPLGEGRVKVVLEAIPDEMARQECIRLLTRLSRNSSRDEWDQRLERLPFLVGLFPARKGEQLVSALERCGAKARAIPLARDAA